MMEEKLPSVLTFTYDLINKTRLSSTAYVIVSVDNRVMYITKEVLASKHDCVLSDRCCCLKTPKLIANCKKFNSGNSLRLPHMTESYWHTLYCAKKSHLWCREPKCECKLCVKTVPASLKVL